MAYLRTTLAALQDEYSNALEINTKLYNENETLKLKVQQESIDKSSKDTYNFQLNAYESAEEINRLKARIKVLEIELNTAFDDIVDLSSENEVLKRGERGRRATSFYTAPRQASPVRSRAASTDGVGTGFSLWPF